VAAQQQQLEESNFVDPAPADEADSEAESEAESEADFGEREGPQGVSRCIWISCYSWGTPAEGSLDGYCEDSNTEISLWRRCDAILRAKEDSSSGTDGKTTETELLELWDRWVALDALATAVYSGVSDQL